MQGEHLLEAWMVHGGGLGGLGIVQGEHIREHKFSGNGGESGGRRRGLGVWYQTKTYGNVKKEESDFLAISKLDKEEGAAIPGFRNHTARGHLWKVAMSIPMSSLKDTMEEKKGLLIRHSLVRKHARLKLLTTYRDAHIYFFPFWIKDMVKRNEKFESISEDLIGWWAKSEWQDGLGEKLGLGEVLAEGDETGESGSHHSESIEEEIDLGRMSTARSGMILDEEKPQFASRVRDPTVTNGKPPSTQRKLKVPPILAYINPTSSSSPFIRRVDSSALLLSVSLLLARLESIEDATRPPSPFAHAQKVAYPAGLAQRSTVTRADCLLADNVTVEEKCVIKESVIGANCQIATSAKLIRCLLMDGVVVEEKCQLTGCIIGRRSRIGRESVLKECEVQDGNVVADETEATGEKFMVFDSLDEVDDEIGNDDGIDDDDGSGLELS
jgi:translation initiation factor eIF-2B subunit gamma